MKKIIKNSFFIDFISLYIPLFLIEIIFRLISKYPLLDLSMIRIASGVFFITTILTFVFSLFNKVIKRILEFITILAASVYACAQLGFFNFIGVYISFQESSQLGAVKDYVMDFLRSFKPQYFLVLIPIVLFITMMIITAIKLKNIEKTSFKNTAISTIALLVLSSFIYTGTLTLKVFDTKYQSVSNVNLFLTVSNTTNSVTKFGTSTFALLDIRQKVFPITIKTNVFTSNLITKSDYDIEGEPRGLTDEEWDKIISYTDNEEYNNINNYFKNSYSSSTNEYTGMFEGKNVIFILMESVNDIYLARPDYYPNIYKMATEGYNFVNNYSPRNSCATLNNEFSGMTSLYSISKVCTEKKYIDNTYYQNVFEVFNSSDYVTFSAHNYTEAYYPRNRIHTTLGSGEYFGVQKLKIPYSPEYINWSSDADFMAQVLKIIDNKTQEGKPFMTWLTTVSSHQPYVVDSKEGKAYYNMTANDSYSNDVRRYMSKLKILDEGLGILLQGLESRGILDDTVIVLYGDHYPYGLPLNHINEVLDYDTSVDKSSEKVPLIIYNHGMEPKEITDYTTYVDILPTIANLFDLEYDPSLYLGMDVFDKNFQSIVIFADGSWKNENAFYDVSTGEVKFYNDKYTEEDVARITAAVATKLQVSEQIITTNYFNYLHNTIQTIEAEESNMCVSEISYKEPITSVVIEEEYYDEENS